MRIITIQLYACRGPLLDSCVQACVCVHSVCMHECMHVCMFCLCICSYMCAQYMVGYMHMYVHTCGKEINIRCIPLSLFTIVFETGSLTKDGTYQFYKISRPAIPRGNPVSASPALGLQVHSTLSGLDPSANTESTSLLTVMVSIRNVPIVLGD